MEDEIEVLIPYFSMRDLTTKQSLCLKVYINRSKYSTVKFAIIGKEITVSSKKHKQKKYYTKIWLPVNVEKINEDSDITYNDATKCFTVLLKKSENISSYKLTNLDVITRFLAWRGENFQEESDVLINSMKTETSVGESVNSSLATLNRSCLVKHLKELNLSSDFDSNLMKGFSDFKIDERLSAGSYGFAGRYRNRVSQFEGNWQIGIEISNPDESSYEERSMLRWEQERRAFDVEHYLADYFLEQTDGGGNLPMLFRSIKIKPYWHRIDRAEEKVLKPHQMMILAGLTNKKFGLNSCERLEVLHSLLDIILAYAYDFRVTNGNHNCESAWNINKLSATLSWFQVHKNVGDAVNCFFRRSLTYPLFRFWSLSTTVFYDALEIFYLGRRQLLNCLVTIYEIFEEDGDRKLLNELYIEDYLVWIQQVHPHTIKNYIKLIKSCIKLKKNDVFSVLLTLESEGRLILDHNPAVYDSWKRNTESLTNLIRNREVNTGEDSSDSCDNSSDSEHMDI